MMTLTQPRSLTLKLETVFIFSLGLAIFISKPLIYLSILLLIGVTLVRIATDPDYRHQLFDNRLFWASSGVFVLGVVSAAIGSSYAEDIGWMARKTLMLTLIVPLLFAFAKKSNRTAALCGAILGFWIAFVLTGNMYNWAWNGDRYQGATWSVDGWGVVCAMLMCALLPYLFTKDKKVIFQILLFLTFVCAALMLITTGARGPWLGVASAVAVYILFKQLKFLPLVAIIVAIFFYSLFAALPNQMASIQSRAQSISQLAGSDASINIRLALWETGASLIIKELLTGDKGFWFGHGQMGKSDLVNSFYSEIFTQQAQFKSGVLEEHQWKINDLHNMYLESFVQNGAVWTLSCLFLLTWLALGPLHRGQKFTQSWASAPSLINFLVIGITYTLLPHFAFLFAIFFMALGRGLHR